MPTLDPMVEIAEFGTWSSPLSARDTVAGQIGFSDILWDAGSLYWVELRPEEGGRQTLMRLDGSGAIDDLTPDHNVRSRVHEYGGGAVIVGRGQVIFSEFDDQRLYAVSENGINPISAASDPTGSVRFADGRMLDESRLVCVRESHHRDGEVLNELVIVDIGTGAEQVIVGGSDFYAAPRPNADASRLAWIEWDHPNMPWDATRLRVARLTDGGLEDVVTIREGEAESVTHPKWGPDGKLYFISDDGGYWNLWRWDGESADPLHILDADFTEPHWIFGRPSYAFLAGGRIACGYWRDATHTLSVIDVDGSRIDLGDELANHTRLISDGGEVVWFVGTGATTPATLFQLNIATAERRIIRANETPIATEYLSRPRPITFPTADGERAHALYYPPANPGFTGPSGSAPPLLVHIHGGPTSHVSATVNPEFLYWTSRGIGVVDLNYRGSTAYGRIYRDRLKNSWGITDVDDAASAARYLVGTGDADPDRLVISGGSAGGYTTLAALAFGDTFTAGGSYYGIADLDLMNQHTHKFEARYLDSLVTTDPEEIRRRSPIHSVDRIEVPVILFQGLEDKVVPPEQAELIAAALEQRGVPYAHITYPTEGHGFRHADNIVHSLESELAFYGKVLGFEPAGDLPEVPIHR